MPNHLHEPIALAAFQYVMSVVCGARWDVWWYRAGKHVILEKPISTTVASSKRIIAGALRANRLLLVAENAQYWKEILTVRDILQSGRLGKVISARAKCWESTMGTWSTDYVAGAWRTDNAKAGGGFVFDSASHWIRPLRMWFGDIVAVTAVTCT